MITVRLATSDDLEPLTASYTAAWREGFRDMFSAVVFFQDDFDERRQQECHEALHDEQTDVQVAELDGRVVGFSSVIHPANGAASQIVGIWVHPYAWGSGAGQALLAAIEDQHRSAGRTNLTTWVPEDSPRARRLFEKASWRPTGQIGTLDTYPEQPNRTFEYERTLV